MTAARTEQAGHQHAGHQHAAHQHAGLTAHSDRRWLAAALSVIAAFLLGEIVVGLLSGSLALLADAAHMLTDAAALALAIGTSKLVQRPARDSFTFGFTRLDALSAQANGITLVILAVLITIQAIRRLLAPPEVAGGAVVVVAVIGVLVNAIAVWMASRANQTSLNVRGAVAHLVTDLWSFVATAVAGTIILMTGWTQADAIASLFVVVLLVRSGLMLLRASGRVFLEASPRGIEPAEVGTDMAAIPGVSEIHDLHIWDLGGSEAALSAHVVVDPEWDCHRVADAVRTMLNAEHHIDHATLQVDHLGDSRADITDCGPAHGRGYGVAHGTSYVAADVATSGVESDDPAR